MTVVAHFLVLSFRLRAHVKANILQKNIRVFVDAPKWKQGERQRQQQQRQKLSDYTALLLGRALSNCKTYTAPRSQLRCFWSRIWDDGGGVCAAHVSSKARHQILVHLVR